MNDSRIIKVSWTGLISVYLVILAGSVVRVSGSGMGCPDWPKCFGNYIPPTNVSQLDPDYRQVYSDIRKKKIGKFADLMQSIGFNETAEQLRVDESLLVEEEFNARKTWTEYINRLIGAMSGLFVFVMFLGSLKYWKNNKMILFLATIQVIVLGFQGWMGSVVVATNLTPWVITAHMIPALFIVGNQLSIIHRIKPVSKTKVSSAFYWILLVTCVVTLAQIILGTQLRQEIDAVSYEMGFEARDNWIDQIGAVFPIHRSFSWTVFIGTCFLFWYNYRNKAGLQLVNWLSGMVLFAVLSGMVMAYLGMPAIAQSTHLILSILMFSLQWWLLITTSGTGR